MPQDTLERLGLSAGLGMPRASRSGAGGEGLCMICLILKFLPASSLATLMLSIVTGLCELWASLRRSSVDVYSQHDGLLNFEHTNDVPPGVSHMSTRVPRGLCNTPSCTEWTARWSPPSLKTEDVFVMVDRPGPVMEPELNCSSVCDFPLCLIQAGVSRQDGQDILRRLCSLSS
ncbi:hypothetical protein ILYODFUR_020664, partial [Ilyodon furcidens]